WILRRARIRRSGSVHRGDAPGHVSRDHGASGHVEDTRIVQNSACATRLEQTRMAGPVRCISWLIVTTLAASPAHAIAQSDDRGEGLARRFPGSCESACSKGDVT